jgi:phosphatidylglycerol:prolipoprotein diacylglycerol transferase
MGFVLGPITMGQILSTPMVLVGTFMLVWGYHKAGLKTAQDARNAF